MPSGGARPGSGRKPKAPHLKIVKGGRSAAVEASAPTAVEAPAEPMIAPNDLNERERFHFGDIVNMLEGQKRGSSHYVPVVTLLSRRLAEVERLSAVIEVVGDTFESKTVRKAGKIETISTMVRARPEVAMRSEAMRHCQSLLAELMLSPAAALKIASPTKPDSNPFDAF